MISAIYSLNEVRSLTDFSPPAGVGNRASDNETTNVSEVSESLQTILPHLIPKVKQETAEQASPSDNDVYSAAASIINSSSATNDDKVNAYAAVTYLSYLDTVARFRQNQAGYTTPESQAASQFYQATKDSSLAGAADPAKIVQL